MMPIGANRVGHREREERNVAKSDGGAKHPVPREVVAATVAVLRGLTRWNGKLFEDLSDSSSIRLQREIERALLPFFPSDDGRQAGAVAPEPEAESEDDDS